VVILIGLLTYYLPHDQINYEPTKLSKNNIENCLFKQRNKQLKKKMLFFLSESINKKISIISSKIKNQVQYVSKISFTFSKQNYNKIATKSKQNSNKIKILVKQDHDFVAFLI